MRTIGEIQNPYCKATLFAWNQKFIIKLESGLLEQTFKISQLDLPDESSVRAILTDDFLKNAMQRFDEMHAALGQALSGI